MPSVGRFKHSQSYSEKCFDSKNLGAYPGLGPTVPRSTAYPDPGAWGLQPLRVATPPPLALRSGGSGPTDPEAEGPACTSPTSGLRVPMGRTGPRRARGWGPNTPKGCTESFRARTEFYSRFSKGLETIKEIVISRVSWNA